MITIKAIDLKAVARLDKELGNTWRKGLLSNGDCNDCAEVSLSDSIILKAHTNGAILLDKGGVKASLESYEYLEVTIC